MQLSGEAPHALEDFAFGKKTNKHMFEVSFSAFVIWGQQWVIRVQHLGSLIGYSQL